MVYKKGKSTSKESTSDENCRTTCTPVWLSQSDTGTIIAIHAQPGAKRDAVVGLFNERLKVALTAPPVEGKANAHLMKFLGKQLGCAKSSLELVGGDTSRTKRILVRGMSAAEVVEKIGPVE